jgi:HK97 family phage major capsid protein
MKSITELRAEYDELLAQNKSIIDAVKGENRGIKSEELDKHSRNLERMAEINDEIAQRNKELQNAQSEQRVAEHSTIQQEIRKAISERRNDIFIGLEHRSADFQVSGSAAAGSNLVGTVVESLLPVLRDRLVLANAGATILTGLKDNVVLPTYSGSTASWAAENDAVSTGAGTFSYVTLTPKRLSSSIKISNELLACDTAGVEQMILKDIVDSIANKFESTVLGSAAATATAPKGIFNGLTAVTASWANVVGLETSVDGNNALSDNAKYIMHTKLFGKLKTVVKATGEGAGFLLDKDNTLNGYAADRSNVVAEDTINSAYGIAFGDWSEFVIGQWGNIRLTIDNISCADTDCTKITVNSSWDGAIRNDNAIATAMFK